MLLLFPIQLLYTNQATSAAITTICVVELSDYLGALVLSYQFERVSEATS